MRERVQEILMEIGIPANLKGFKYILDIMELFEEDEAWRNAKMMIVYEKVARMNKTNYCRVEKSIRYAFSNAVTYGDLALVEKYLSVVNVTNGNLLHTLYARVSEEQREEKKANLPLKLFRKKRKRWLTTTISSPFHVIMELC